MQNNYTSHKKRTLSVLLSIAIMAILIFFLLKSITFRDLKDFYSLINFGILLIASPFYLITYLLRTHRFYHLLDRKIKYGELLGIVSVHNFFLNLLPARLGELSYLRMIHKRGISPIKNVKSLVFVRFNDLLVIALFFAIFVNFSKFSVNSYVFPLSLLIIFLLFLVLFKPNLFLYFVKIVNQKVFAKYTSLQNKIDRLVAQLEDEIRILTFREFLVLFMTSALIWFCGFMFNYLLLVGLGIETSFVQVMIAVSILLFYSMLPIYTPGGLGVTEGVWASSLILYGVSNSLAILAGFYIHITQLLLTILFGAAGYLLLRLK